MVEPYLILTRHKGEGQISTRIDDIEKSRQSMIIQSTYQIHVLMESFKERLGLEEFSSLLYEAGYRSGKESAILTYNYLNNNESDFWDFWIKAVEETGGGWFKVLNLDLDDEKKKAKLRIKNSFLTRHLKKSNNPSCWYISGYFNGTLEAVWGADLVTREKKCESMGDPYCEFHTEGY